MANTAQNREHCFEEAHVEHRFGQLHVTEVAWAHGHVLSACLTLQLAVRCAKPRVVQATMLGATAVHELIIDFRYGHQTLQE